MACWSAAQVIWQSLINAHQSGIQHAGKPYIDTWLAYLMYLVCLHVSLELYIETKTHCILRFSSQITTQIGLNSVLLGDCFEVTIWQNYLVINKLLWVFFRNEALHWVYPDVTVARIQRSSLLALHSCWSCQSPKTVAKSPFGLLSSDWQLLTSVSMLDTLKSLLLVLHHTWLWQPQPQVGDNSDYSAVQLVSS